MNEPSTIEHKPAWWKNRWVGISAAGVVGILVGVAAAPGAEPTTVAGPTVTVTPAPEVETVTETVTETVVPDDCLALIEDAETLLGLSGEYVSIIGDLSTAAADAVDAAYYGDAYGMELATEDISALLVRMDSQQTVIDGLRVDTHAAGCQAGA